MGHTITKTGFSADEVRRALELPVWKWERAVHRGLVPRPDLGSGRWSARSVAQMRGGVEALRARIGDLPDLGAVEGARVLSVVFGTTVEPHALRELVSRGLIREVGVAGDQPLYDGVSLEAFNDRAALVSANAVGRLLDRDQVAIRLRVRLVDVEQLVLRGWLKEAPAVGGRGKAVVPRYRAGDVDALRDDLAIDWTVVRATGRGLGSALAMLPRRA